MALDSVKDFATSAVLLGAGGVVTWLLAQRAAKLKKEEELHQRVVDLESKLAVLNQVVVPISTAFQALLIKELTHYHTPVMDSLMQKLGPPNTLTPAEEVELAALLAQRTRDMGAEIGESERDAAAMLPLVMRRVHLESAEDPSELEIKVVGLPDVGEA